MKWTDWRKELAMFYGSDINKSSYIGKYAVDSVESSSGNGEVVISYKATDPSLKTQLMEITRQKPDYKVTLIHIINKSSNFLSTTEEELFYEPMKSYLIKSSQDVRLFGENTFAVKGDIVAKQKTYF